MAEVPLKPVSEVTVPVAESDGGLKRLLTTIGTGLLLMLSNKFGLGLSPEIALAIAGLAAVFVYQSGKKAAAALELKTAETYAAAAAVQIPDKATALKELQHGPLP